jgi:uncharacterized membrane protein
MKYGGKAIRIGAAAVLAATTVAISGAGSASAATCTWTPSTLPIPSGATGSTFLEAADNLGGYAGYATFSGNAIHAIHWHNGTTTDYGTLAGGTSIPADINRAGTMVGEASDSPTTERAFTSQNNKLVGLAEPTGTLDSWATGINDNGDIVGSVEVPGTTKGSTVIKAVWWPAAAPGTVQVLTGLPTGQSQALAIDQDGTIAVAVASSSSSSDNRPYLWHNGTVRALPTLTGATNVTPRAISNGVVVGSSNGGSFSGAVLWDTTTATPTISTVASNGNALSVNKNGQITGWTVSAGISVVYHIWQRTQLVATITANAANVNISSDDGTVAGSTSNGPTVWTCK